MSGMNIVILFGNLTADPDLRTLPSGALVIEFGLAMNRKWANREGEPQEETVFVDCEMYGKSAELMSKSFRKGDPILIEGRLKFGQWVDRSGANRSKVSVVATSFQYIKPKEDRPPALQKNPNLFKLEGKEIPEEEIPF